MFFTQSDNCTQLVHIFYIILVFAIPTMFCTQSDNCTQLVHIFDIILVFAAELEEPKIGICGKGLIPIERRGEKELYLNDH